ncbi:hypothetical protein JCM11957_03020 [Caminibacter profundus]
MKEDLLNTEPKKDLKKPLVYGAIGFLIFIIIVIAIAIFQNTTSKNENNEIIPPVEKPKTTLDAPEFKPLKVEENQENNIDTQKLIEEKPKEEQTPKEEKIKEEKINPQINETPKEEPKKEEKPKKEAPKKATQGNYYIQVAALLKNAKPNKKFLSLIKKEGFNYKTYHTYIVKNGEKIKVTKILIGPFETKKEAKKALKKVKASISQTAFIFKVK